VAGGRGPASPGCSGGSCRGRASSPRRRRTPPPPARSRPSPMPSAAQGWRRGAGGGHGGGWEGGGERDGIGQGVGWAGKRRGLWLEGGYHSDRSPEPLAKEERAGPTPPVIFEKGDGCRRMPATVPPKKWLGIVFVLQHQCKRGPFAYSGKGGVVDNHPDPPSPPPTPPPPCPRSGLGLLRVYGNHGSSEGSVDLSKSVLEVPIPSLGTPCK